MLKKANQILKERKNFTFLLIVLTIYLFMVLYRTAANGGPNSC
jgi:hypothetical protein